MSNIVRKKVSKQLIEKKTLMVGAATNLFMAFAGWLAYYLSNSQALALDGNFSFVAFITVILALRVSAIKLNQTSTFPFGQFAYESLFSMVKGLMIIGMLLMALIVNIERIFHYLAGEPANVLDTDVIFIYSVMMVFLCFSLAFYYKQQNKRLSNASTLLLAEYTGVKLDGLMSLGIGIALVSIRFIDIEGYFGFLHYIGDALLIIALVFLFGKEPLTLVRHSFIELAGGTLQNTKQKQHIESIIAKHLSEDGLLVDSYISKTGSCYLVVAYISITKLETIDGKAITATKAAIEAELNQHYPHSMLELSLK
ncbi:cation transporter [Colwellia sp. TT2012]|uniref:cation transporter n=1 Tax=Colwellia sp. TT2012 TaxID=1720342 RepID=UPI00070B5307|nr:cation transporter [Colwellia sp. TT2012]